MSGLFALVPYISIHAPLTGSDLRQLLLLNLLHYFNPRSPYGERLPGLSLFLEVIMISIHAPLTGSDGRCLPESGRLGHFNPRSPYGERRPNRPPPCAARRFQSTLPLRGATAGSALTTVINEISIHAPLTGSDSSRLNFRSTARAFQSTLPLRGATDSVCAGIHEDPFQSTLPLRGATLSGIRGERKRSYFNPRSPYGERPGL